MLKIEQLQYLKEKQLFLDNYILETKKIKNNKEIHKKKIIAFLVEISEFINEYRAFKFWSSKGPSEKSIILEELIDCIHFVISLGLDINYDFSQFNEKKINNKDINQWSLNVYQKTLYFEQNFNHESYYQLLNEFLQILGILNISSNEIIEVYDKKNQINFNRQNSGY